MIIIVVHSRNCGFLFKLQNTWKCIDLGTLENDMNNNANDYMTNIIIKKSYKIWKENYENFKYFEMLAIFNQNY